MIVPFSSAIMMQSTLQTGIGLRAQHHAQLLRHRPQVGWLEAHTENYFCSGGMDWRYLVNLREHYPLSLHGVGLSLGSTDPLSQTHLGRISGLVRDIDPFLVSEHLSWSSVNGRFSNDLLPLPYTEECLVHVANRVAAVQDQLGRQILIENVSSYLQFADSTLREWDFLRLLTQVTGCGILLDVNNLYINACNHGFSVNLYLEALPPAAVQEIHLAGHRINRVGTQQVRIDTHDTRVCSAVWECYSLAVMRFPGVPALIEWDSDIPALEVLLAEAHSADAIARPHHVSAA
jgi:uncharacterized protein